MPNWLKALASCVAVVAALNIIAVVVIGALDGPSPYFARLEPGLKTQTMKGFVARSGPPLVVTVGSSIADMGFDVQTIDKLLKAEGVQSAGFNFGVNGAGPLVFRELLARVIFKLAQPKVLIYGVSAIEFNASSDLFRADQNKFMASAGLSVARDGLNPSSALRVAMFSAFPLFRLGELIWPNAFVDSDGWNWLTRKDFKAEFNGQQRVTVTWAQQRAGLWPEWANERYRKLLFGYRPSAEALSALADVVRLCRDHNVQVLVVNMPVMTSSTALEGTVFSEIDRQNGVRWRQSFEDSLQTELRRLGVPYLDVGTKHSLPDDDFGDPFHLNQVGAMALAELLAPRIKPMLQSD